MKGSQIHILTMSKPFLSKAHVGSKHLHEVLILSLATMLKSFMRLRFERYFSHHWAK